jgi:dihydroflavonol-4-reductase
VYAGSKVRALITGAAGFIGSHLVDAMLEAGHEPVCFIRPEDDTRWLAGKEVTILYGDCTDRESFGRALDPSIRYVFHLAAVLDCEDCGDYRRVNVGGMKNLLELCLEKNIPVERIVYTSSVTVNGPSRKDRPIRESDPCRPINDYAQSKLEAEQLLRSHGDRIPFTILRPTLVYGPRLFHGGYSIFHFALRGFVPRIGRGVTNVIHVRDLAACMLAAALSQEVKNEVLFVGEPRHYGYGELCRIISEVSGRRTVSLAIPLPLVFLIAAALGMSARITGRKPALNLRRARDMRYRYWMVDTAKMVTQLGFTPSCEFREGARDTLEWYRRQDGVR